MEGLFQRANRKSQKMFPVVKKGKYMEVCPYTLSAALWLSFDTLQLLLVISCHDNL